MWIGCTMNGNGDFVLPVLSVVASIVSLWILHHAHPRVPH